MTTRRFDGPTLEAALAKVRAELGPDARITGAEKVRQGGVGGFFAKERVEVMVEVTETEAAAAAAIAAPTSAPATPPAAPIPSPVRDRLFAPGASILDLADSISDEEEEVTTETTSFAAVLERIAAEADVAVAAQTAIDPEPVAEPAAATGGQFAHHGVEIDRRFEMAKPATPVRPARPARPLVAARSTAVAVPRHVGQLQRLGLPGDLVPYDVTVGVHCALVDAMANLPVAPALPSGKGTVLAVVGDRATATSIAKELSVDMRLDPEDVVICSPKRRGRASSSWLELTTVEDADEHRRSWRWRIQPTVVVIDAPPVGRAQSWARDMLSVLEPTSAWGVVDATRKLEDIASWSDDLGGLDAFAVNRLADTVSPATVLHLGVPVALLDGEPASPELWADVLMERLAA